jgi:hypothetical protein
MDDVMNKWSNLKQARWETKIDPPQRSWQMSPVLKLLNSFHKRSPHCILNIPGHFFNTEHSPYLLPMFSPKKHRSMHLCNHVTKVTKINTWQFYKMVKLFEEEIHIMQLFYASQSIRNVCDFPMQHMIDQCHQSEQFLTLFQNLWCSV